MRCHETIKERGVGHREVVERQHAAAAHGRFGLVLILVAAFMVVLDFSIVNVALPSIQRELGISAASVQWVIMAYAIAFGGLLILGGRASDLYGGGRMFLAGIGVFTAASLASGVARGPGGRAPQRPGAAERRTGGARRWRNDGRARRAVADHHRLSRGPAADQGL